MNENTKLLIGILGIRDTREFREEAMKIFRDKYPDAPDGVLAGMIDEAVEKCYEAYAN